MGWGGVEVVDLSFCLGLFVSNQPRDVVKSNIWAGREGVGHT